MHATLRRWLEAGLATRGYGLRLLDRPPRDFAAFLAAYRRAAPVPRSVLDIGVGQGTDWLYDAFPEARLILFEPRTSCRDAVARLQARREAVCHWVALAEQDGELTLHVPQRVPTGASLLPRDPAWSRVQDAAGAESMAELVVPVRTLDGLAGDVAGPTVVKIDVEGAELQVLRGGPRVLAGADLVIVESSVARRSVGGADFIDIAAHLRAAGFVLVDIIDIASYGSPRTLAYMDLAFVPADGAYLRHVTRAAGAAE